MITPHTKLTLPQFFDMVMKLPLNVPIEYAYEYRNGELGNHWGLKRINEFDSDILLFARHGGGGAFCIDVEDRWDEDVYNDLKKHMKESLESEGGENVLFLVK